jgi:23S rRNA (cytosine1962-C5)-methyltransferase
MARNKEACADQVTLPNTLEQVLGSGHPWVYRDHIPKGFVARGGSWVEVRAGRTTRFGLWDESSSIAIRLFSSKACPDAEWISARVREAVELRLVAIPADTNAYRVIYGEGDNLPGITVDKYGDYAVIVTYADCLSALVPTVAKTLLDTLGLRGVLHRRSDEAKGTALTLVHGTRPPSDLVILERGLKFYADLEIGQKTGLFLDQRDNRHALAPYVRDASVLNLFCYTGGFSVVAAHYGAKSVTSVDIAAPAVKRAADNMRLNGFDSSEHEYIAEDCYDYLAKLGESARRFDVVICDPPSLARNRAQLDGAIKAYTLLNARGLACVKPGGFYAAASCTSQVSPEAFRSMLVEAARRAKVRLQIVGELGHAADHPQQIGHPEGRYLKFMLLRVLELA